ncbi:MAG: hypothetical protein CUN55_11295 [Phototrophicales bacterium]|nr:MAG: hypothetical protein CUN55_11295 [Phototrophicales bacterium]
MRFIKIKLAIMGLVLATLLSVATPTPSFAQDGGTTPVTVIDAFGNEVVIEDTSRIITIGGSVTEIVFELGAGDRVIARDDSSLYPPSVNELESVGYVRQLSAEPVLALNPTLIITNESAGPPEAIEQLQSAGVTLLIVPSAESVEEVIANVETIATALSLPEAGAEIIAQIENDYAQAQALLETIETKPRVMFIYARGAGSVSVAGTNTSAATMIELAGGENVVSEYEGYQPITAEAVVAANPEVILIMTRGLESLGGIEGLLEQPGIAITDAGVNKRIIAIDDLYLLGFSTRIGSAILDLTYLLHNELEPPILTLLRVDGRFYTLLNALERAGQLSLLESDTPYTLFAPTDEAFAQLPDGMLEGLMSSTISLQAVLSYHLVEGYLLASDLSDLNGQSIQSLYSNGQLLVTVQDESIFLNETVKVTQSDLTAANGVIHIIDGVLIPERP